MGLHKGTHRRRTEALDWRRIASLDLEKILEDPDGGNTLKEILPQIAFCQAELEFDAEKTDPGFRKVFQLSQIIIEHLIEHQKSALEKAATLELKCIALAQQTEQNTERIKLLNQKLTEAKRELRKRKELIVSGQSEILGRDNNDEFDQCPYCTKKFMTSIYLYAHLQRRHQGLPIHPVFNPQNNIVHQNQLNLGVLSTNAAAKPMQAYSVTSATQTEESVQNQINLQTVSNLVENYLQQKTAESHGNKLLPSSLQTGESSERRRNSIEEAERHIASMKEELENQWKNLAQKIQQTGIEELKSTLIGEMHKMQDIIAKTNVGESTVAKEIEAKAAAPSPSVLIERVEERFQKQEVELDHLRKNIQSKMQDDLGIIESKLESQERFWRCKLRTVEQEYRQQINFLREEVHASITQQRQAHEQLPAVKSAPISPIAPASPRKNLIATPPKVPVKKPEIPAVPVSSPKPVPKPRKAVPSSSLETEVEEVTQASSQKLVKPAKEAPVPPVNHAALHEYEEPGNADNSDHVSDYSFSEPSLSDTELSQLKKKERQEKMRTEQMSQMDLVRNRVLDNMKHKMEQLGVDPEGSQLLKEDMSKVLGRMKHQRSKIIQNDQDAFAAERQAVKQEAQNAAKSKTLEGKIEFQITKPPAPPIPSPATTPTRNFALNEPKSPSASKSPLVKMYNALKNVNIKKKMSFFRTKHTRSRLLIPNPSPRKVQKPSFFRRRGKKESEKGGKADTSFESPDEDEVSSRERTASTSRTSTVLVKDKKRRVSRTNRQLSKSLQLAKTMTAMAHMNVLSDSETEDEACEGQKKTVKSDTSSWKSSELHKNAKEAIKKSTIPIVSQIAVGSESRRSSIAQLQVKPRSVEETDKSSDRRDDEGWDLTYSDSSLSVKNDTKKPTIRAVTTSGSDSENYERPITAVRREDHEKGQYVSLKVPEPKVIVYNKKPSNNAFGLLNNPYFDEPDFVSSTPVRNQDVQIQKQSTSKETPQTPNSSKLQPNQKAAAAFSAAPVENSTSSVSDWDNTSDDHSGKGKRVEYPKNSPKREDFVVHTPKRSAALPARPQPVPVSPKKSPASTLIKKVSTASPAKNVTSPLKKTLPPWSVSTVNRPPTAGTRNTKHSPSSAVQRK